MQAANGDLYGTAEEGGASIAGTIFKITLGGQLITLHNFCSQSGCLDGAAPSEGLVQATDGNLYGTTNRGGTYNAGTVFKITSGGQLATLHNFRLEFEAPPQPSGLVQATNGYLYGITNYGGPNGTVFKITPGGQLTNLYAFCLQSCADGAGPFDGLVQATDGNLYGTTWAGGAYNAGTIFKITLDGSLTTLYNFCSQSGCLDGSGPLARLIQATDGNLYGTTYVGGAYDYGTIFRITLSGSLTTLYNFCSQGACLDGAWPVTSLMQATSGDFYGSTSYGGGPHAGGTIFRLSVGLGPFLKTLEAAGKAGSNVTILGNNLTGATSVTFNGTPAAPFAVNSSGTAILTTVPASATTGQVQVTTPGGTLSTYVPFGVLP